MASLLPRHEEESKSPLDDLALEQDGCCRARLKNRECFQLGSGGVRGFNGSWDGLLNKILPNLMAVAKPEVSQWKR